MNNEVCFVGFDNTIASKVLVGLSGYRTHTIDSDVRSINNFVLKVNSLGAKYIIGLGQYSGKDKDKLRIETFCNKNFRNDEIKMSEHLQLDDFLKPIVGSKRSMGLGNSWCNLLSVMMVNTPNRNYRYTFIHIPKNFKSEVVVKEILMMIPNQ